MIDEYSLENDIVNRPTSTIGYYNLYTHTKVYNTVT